MASTVIRVKFQQPDLAIATRETDVQRRHPDHRERAGDCDKGNGEPRPLNFAYHPEQHPVYRHEYQQIDAQHL